MSKTVKLLQQAAQCLQKAQAIEDRNAVQRIMKRELRAQQDCDWGANHYEPEDTQTSHGIEQALEQVNRLIASA